MIEPIRVALIDDQQLVRGGFKMLIDSQPDLTVVGEAENGLEAIELLAQIEADVVLMDVRMPELNGIEATERIIAGSEKPPRIIVLTTFDLDEYVLEAIHAGASGFLLKDAAPEELLNAVRHVHRGEAVISPIMTKRLLGHIKPLLKSDRELPEESNEHYKTILEQLTARETEVLKLIADGFSNIEIAKKLVLSEATVKTHVANILRKTSSRDRVQAVVFAYESGLVTP